MSVITKGKTFANGEQLTAGKLNQMLDAATFSSAAVDNTKTTLSGGAITIAPNAITTTEIAQSFLDSIYPIGSIYTNATDSTNPGTLLGFGTWDEFAQGEVPVGRNSSDPDFDVVGSGTNTNGTTGAKTHTLDVTEIPAHTHTVTSGNSSNAQGSVPFESASTADNSYTTNSTGGGGAHNNLQPYIVVYMWQRTA